MNGLHAAVVGFQVIQEKLTVIVDIGLRPVEHAHRTANAFTSGSLGDAGLEYVLEADFLFLISDGEELRSEFLQILQGHLLGIHNGTEILIFNSAR